MAAEAERSGRSVAAVIREAIDFRFPESDTAERLRAAAELFRMTDHPEPGVGDGPQELKEVYAAALVEKAEPV